MDFPFDPNRRRHGACGGSLVYDNRTESNKVDPKYKNITVQLTGQDGNAYRFGGRGFFIVLTLAPFTELMEFVSEVHMPKFALVRFPAARAAKVCVGHIDRHSRST
jgi:hypothetical protein